MSQAHKDLKKAVRADLSYAFPKTVFKLSTLNAPKGRRAPENGNTLYVEFFEQHLAEKGIEEKQVRAIAENIVNSPLNESAVSRVVFRRKTAPVRIVVSRQDEMAENIREMIEADEENREVILQTMEVLAKSLSRNDSRMVMNVVAEYDEVED